MSLRGLITASVLLAVLWAVGCTSPAGLQGADGSVPGDQNPVPFHDADAKASHGESSASQDQGSKSEYEIPFHDPQNLPAGTLLAVRLRNSVSAPDADGHGSFEAVVDQDVVIEGNKMVPLGTTVSGRVESARASRLKRNQGYVRLTLDSIQLAGTKSPVETASLFVNMYVNTGQAPSVQSRSVSSKASLSLTRLEKGRRLIFRLTEPVYLATSQRTPAVR